MESSRVKVCVVGAGTAGLIASKNLIENSQHLDVTVLEQSNQIAGIWCPQDPLVDKNKNENENGGVIRHNVYKSMRMNFPKDLMAIGLDFPFQEPTNSNEASSFATVEEVNNYFHRYAHHYDLLKNIQFNTKVTNVKPIVLMKNQNVTNGKNSQAVKWLVSTQNVKTSENKIMEFDAVIICQGYYWRPFIPVLPNVSLFEGQIMHSRDYRVPDAFRNQRVLVIGGGISGTEISLELLPVAKQLLWSVKNPTKAVDVTQVGPIKTMEKDRVIFEDGTEYVCDVIVSCTGYKYDFPFLDKSCLVQVEQNGKEVTPLYRHFIHTKYPTLCIIGLPTLCTSFYMFDIQMRFYVKFLVGQLTLPEEMEMNEWSKRDKEIRSSLGFPLNKPHELGQIQWDYYQEMARDGGFEEQLIPVVKKIYEAVEARRVQSPMTYKTDIVRAVDHDNFILIRANDSEADGLNQEI